MPLLFQFLFFSFSGKTEHHTSQSGFSPGDIVVVSCSSVAEFARLQNEIGNWDGRMEQVHTSTQSLVV